MIVKKIYTNDDEACLIVCDQCGRTKTLNISRYKGINKPLKVRCKCDHIFFISIEVRKFYRKKTKLSGEYARISLDTALGLEKGRMVVEDLSRTGIGFRTLFRHTIQMDEVIRVKFILDNAKKSEVERSAVVKRINNYFVGAEFLDAETYSETNRTIGFYLMSH